jgi:hypothetical protein
MVSCTWMSKLCSFKIIALGSNMATNKNMFKILQLEMCKENDDRTFFFLVILGV